MHTPAVEMEMMESILFAPEFPEDNEVDARDYDYPHRSPTSKTPSLNSPTKSEVTPRSKSKRNSRLDSTKHARGGSVGLSLMASLGIGIDAQSEVLVSKTQRLKSVPFGDEDGMGDILDQIMTILVDPDMYDMAEEDLLSIIETTFPQMHWEKLKIEIEYWNLLELAKKMTAIYDAPMASICTCESPIPCQIQCLNATAELKASRCMFEDHGCPSSHTHVVYRQAKCGEILCSCCATVMKIMFAVVAQGSELLELVQPNNLESVESAESLKPPPPRISEMKKSNHLVPGGASNGRRSSFAVDLKPTTSSGNLLSGLKLALGSKQATVRHENTQFLQRWRLCHRLMKREEDIRQEFTDEEDWPGWMKVPDLIKYVDVDAFGWRPTDQCDLNRPHKWDLWHYTIEELAVKNRPEYWNILEFLARELKAGRLALDESFETLVQYRVINVQRLCMAVSMSSMNAMATSLYFAAFMNTKSEEQPNRADEFTDASLQLIELARKMLATIDSDHLAMFLLELPTDLGGTQCLSPIDIAISNKLHEFLDDQRIMRVGQRIWTDFYKLDPQHTFLTAKLSFYELFRRLTFCPAEFYFTPMGQYVVGTAMYVIYALLFSVVTYQRRYDFHDFEPIDVSFWVINAGFVSYEFIELVLSPQDYFTEIANYFDFLLSSIFIALFSIRVIRFKDSLPRDQNKHSHLHITFRNSRQTEVFMALWATACILMWSRIALLLRRTSSFGPLLQMVFNMVADVSIFTAISTLFFVGFAFAVYYVIATDVPGVDGLANVSLYIFQTLNGQQDWQVFDTDTSGNTLDKARSQMVLVIVGLFTVFATIMLLNLLIAMMATTYDNVRERSRKENNFAEISTAYGTEENTSLISAPLNLLAMSGCLLFLLVDLIIWIFTCGKYQLNEEWWSPLTWDTYNVRDAVEYKVYKSKSMSMEVPSSPLMPSHDQLVQYEVEIRQGKIVKIYDTDDYKVNPPPGEHHGRKGCLLPRNDVLIKDDKTGEFVDISEFSIAKVNKKFFRRIRKRAEDKYFNHDYCPYCYYRVGDRRGNIRKFINTFREAQLRLDENDTVYLEHILAQVDEFDNRVFTTYTICPNCYRPFRYLEEMDVTDQLSRYQYVMEIVSFWVFVLILYVPLMIAFAIPAGLSYLSSSINAVPPLDYRKFSRIENETQFRQIVKDQMPRIEEIGDQMERVFAKFKRMEDIANRESHRTKDQFDEQRKNIRMTQTDVRFLHRLNSLVNQLSTRVADKDNVEMLLERHAQAGGLVEQLNEKIINVEDLMTQHQQNYLEYVERLESKVGRVEEMMEAQSELQSKIDHLFHAVENVGASVVEHSGQTQLEMLATHVSSLDSRVSEVKESTGTLHNRVRQQGMISELTSRQLQEQWKQQQQLAQSEQDRMKKVLEEQSKQHEAAVQTTQKLYEVVQRSSQDFSALQMSQNVMNVDPPMEVFEESNVTEFQEVKEEESVNTDEVNTKEVSGNDIDWGRLADPEISFSYDAGYIYEKIRKTDMDDLDGDKSGEVDFDEFKKHFDDVDPIVLRVIFNQADRDGSGDVSGREYYRWRDRRLNLPLIARIVGRCVPQTVNILKAQLAASNELLIKLQQKTTEE